MGVRLIGLDPGLQKTGWGVLESKGTHLSHVANGVVTSDPKQSLSDRLLALHDGLQEVIALWQPEAAAVEEVFVNKNPVSTLKLGQARGMSLLVPALHGIPVREFSANHIKKSVVGVGHAGKEQVEAMVKVILPGVKIFGSDAADALAVAICLAHHVTTDRNLSGGRVQ